MSTRKSILGALLLVALPCYSAAQNANEEFRPEMKGYLRLNEATRFLLLTSFNIDDETRTWQGDFGVHFDFALKPVFRRELASREDVFSRRFLSFLAGYRYITSLGAGAPYLEHRWLVEMTSRFPAPGKLVLIDRNRGEMRFISSQGFSTRYRNKLQVEHHHFVPEIYFLRQNDSKSTPPHVNAFGVTFNLYF